MKPTEILVNEHRVIESMLAVLEKAIQKELKIEDIEKMIDFFKNFADKCHHGKEEDMLFPEMEKAGIPREGGPIGVMLMEHEQGRNFVKGMAIAISEIKKGKNAKDRFAENAKGYINLLREHIYKEDNILFNMADVHIEGSVQQELLKKFEKFDKEQTGGEMCEKYHKLVRELEKIYL